jgi:hypothetical protein
VELRILDCFKRLEHGLLGDGFHHSPFVFPSLDFRLRQSAMSIDAFHA